MLFYSILNLMDLVLRKKEMQLFAKSILKSQEIFEDSWDPEMCNYTLNCREAALKAVEVLDFEFNSEKAKNILIDILTNFNSGYWNDAQWWAESYLKEEPK